MSTSLSSSGELRGTKRPAPTSGRGSSCAECRRLKLKCDRGDSDAWPCLQCRRRKCAELCPGSVSTPTVKAGNEKLLRLYRNKIADLEAKLSEATSQSISSDAPRSGSTPSASASGATREHMQPSRNNSGAAELAAGSEHDFDAISSSVFTHQSAHPPVSSATLDPAPPNQQAIRTSPPAPGQSTHLQGSIYSCSGQSPQETFDAADHLDWSDHASLPTAESVGNARGALADAATSDQTPVLPRGAEADPSVPGGPSFYGRSAGVLHLQPDAENLFETPSVLPSSQMQQLAMSVLPPSLWQAQELLDSYETHVTWMYTPVDVETLRTALKQLYAGSTVMTEPRLSMILLALALGDLFHANGSYTQHGQRQHSFAVNGLREQASQMPRNRATNGSDVQTASAGASTTQGAHGEDQRIFHVGFTCFLRQSSPMGVFAPCVWESAVSAHLAVSYLLSRGNADTSHAAWQILGCGIRQAVSLGLHCSQSAWNLPPERLSAHARVWWELQAYERLQSLNFGRPSCMPEHVSCVPPFTLGAADWRTVKPNREVFHALKYALGPLYAKINLLHCKEDSPTMAHIMSIDAEVRAFLQKVPSWLLLGQDQENVASHGGAAAAFDADRRQSPTPPSVWQHILPQKHMLSLLIHKAILFLHRPFFSEATRKTSEPLLSPYSSSFAAAIGSARQHTLLFKSATESCPSALKWWFFIFHLYTAAVVQAQVLLRCPRSMLATEVQSDFELSFSLLTTAAKTSNVAARAAMHIGTLRSKILRKLGAESSRMLGNTLPTPAARSNRYISGLDALSEAAVSSLNSGCGQDSSLASLSMGAAESMAHSVSTARTNPSPLSNFSATAQDAAASAGAVFLPHEQLRLGNKDLAQQRQNAPDWADFLDVNDLSAILESENLPPELASGPPAQWAWMDPLLQATLFWHTDSNGALERSIHGP